MKITEKITKCIFFQVLTLTLVYRSLPKLGKLNFASDFSLTEAEASECGLEHFFEKVICKIQGLTRILYILSQCMLIVERMERLGITREEFLILKVCFLVYF